MSETSIPQVALIAAELRAIADALDTLTDTPLNRLWVSLQIQPHGADDDEQKVATIDAIGLAVLDEAGDARRMSDGAHHHNASGKRGPMHFSVYSSVISPLERERLAEVARLRAEIEELRAHPASLVTIAEPEAEPKRALVLERKDQPNKTPEIGPIMITPPIDENYWLFRVRLTETQAIVAFPKFGTIGIGFAQEEDWNTNLPYTCETREIFDHIAHNMGDEAITDEDCLAAIEMVRAAAAEASS